KAEATDDASGAAQAPAAARITAREKTRPAWPPCHAAVPERPAGMHESAGPPVYTPGRRRRQPRRSAPDEAAADGPALTGRQVPAPGRIVTLTRRRGPLQGRAGGRRATPAPPGAKRGSWRAGGPRRCAAQNGQAEVGGRAEGHQRQFEE